MAEVKTIVAEVTVHVPGPAYKAFAFTPEHKIIPNSGKYDVVEVKPGTPVELPKADADKLIARGVAKEYVAEVVEAPKVVVAAGAKAK